MKADYPAGDEEGTPASTDPASEEEPSGWEGWGGTEAPCRG